VARFAEVLKAALPDLAPKWSFIDLPDEDHSSTALKTLYSSLETHYASYRFPYFETQAELDSLGGVRAMEEHVVRFASRFGYRAHPPESVVEAVGRIYVLKGRHAEAMELAVAYKTEYPVGAEGLINLTGYDLLQRGLVEQALAAFKRNTMLFSDSPNTYDSLADGYCRAGDEAAARESMRQAVAVAERRSHPRVARYRTRADQPCR
jgi:tetratricopeptide (TPR) repeat protein